MTEADSLPVRYLDGMPLWALFLLTVLLLLAFSELGFRLGLRQHREKGREDSQSAAIMGATLGLLALMLAFSFGVASSRFDARKQALLEEANAIGTTWLRSEMLPEPHPGQLQPLFLRYVEVRIHGGRTENREELLEALDESVDLHDRIWSHAVVLGKEYPRSVVLGLFVDSLNQMIDIHEVRVNVARYRVPRGVIWTLAFIAFAASAMVGLHAGATGGRSLSITSLLAVVLSMVLVMIVDLDRPKQTLFSISDQSLVGVRETIAAAKPP